MLDKFFCWLGFHKISYLEPYWLKGFVNVRIHPWKCTRCHYEDCEVGIW